MRRVYIFGPIYLFGKDYVPFYKQVNRLCERYFDKVISTYPNFWNTKETPRRFYNRTYKVITKCDLFIAEISSPSIGVGMELQMAQDYKIPTMGVCKESIKPSIMAAGIPCVKKIIYYKNLPDILEKLEKELKTKSYLH